MLSCTLNFSSETAISFPNWDLRLALSNLSFCCCVSGQGIEESKTYSLPLMVGCFKCFWLPWMVPLSSFWISHLSQKKVNWQAYGSRQTYLGLVSWEGARPAGEKVYPAFILGQEGEEQLRSLLAFFWICGAFPHLSARQGSVQLLAPHFEVEPAYFWKLFLFLSLWDLSCSGPAGEEGPLFLLGLSLGH